MTFTLSLAFAFVSFAAAQESPPAAAAAETVHPTLEEIFRPPRLLGVRPDGESISADGRFVVYRWGPDVLPEPRETDRAEDETKDPNDGVEPKRDVWLVATNGGEPRHLFAAPDAGEPGVRTWWAPEGARLLVRRDGWLELHSFGDDGSPARVEPLFEVGDDASDPRFLEDGRRVAFTTGKDHRFWTLDLVTGERRSPADALENRAAWFQVLDEIDSVALFAAPSAAAGEKDEKRGGAPSGPERLGEMLETAARAIARVAELAAAPAPTASKEASLERVLWIVRLDGSERTETTFEEEGRVQVSNDGRFAVRIDTEPQLERELILADFLAEHVTVLPVRSSLAGDPPEAARFEMYDVAKREAFAPPLDAGKGYHVIQAEWAPHSPLLLLHRVSDDFHVRQLLVVDPERRAAWTAFAERDDAWVFGPELYASWAEAGDALLFTSERSGFNHLYRCTPEGADVACLTEEGAPFEVSGAWTLHDSERVLVLTNEGDPADQAAWFVDPAGTRTRATPAGGVASAPRVSRDGTTLLWRQETLGVPAELYAARIDGGEPRRLTSTIPPELEALALPPPEIVTYVNEADGTPVRAFLYKPKPFDPAKTYPAVVFVHGAGYLQNVTRSMSAYGVNMLFHHRLARNGYVVLDPDYRHSQGYGRKFRADVYGYMGGKDLDDVVAGIAYLGSLGYVDTARAGIYGGSYGGFLTLMALFTKPDVFACGAALRSVTDWRTYNSWYTTARLGDPVKDAENYRRSSPIDHADGLAKPLLILHGMKDANVFAQDSIRLIEKLIQLGKDFDAMLYPSQDHGFTDPESWIDEYKRIERLFDRHLETP